VPPLSGSLRIAYIAASWHSDIVQQAEQGFLNELASRCPCPQKVDIFTVPGALEIPLHARRLAQFGHYDAIVACGFVVDGGIYQHDFVATAVIDGLMRVQLDTGVPVMSVVLTPHHFHEHPEQVAFFASHFVKKGAEAARACMDTVASLRAVSLTD
jgi:6,7-dimethyl-8-ribityllumazine synthase